MVHFQPISPPRASSWSGRARARFALLLGLGLLFQQRAAGAKVDEGLAAVQRAALAHAGLSPQATTHLLARQHLAALLPQVRVTLGRGWQISATGRVLDGLPVPVPEVDNDHTSYAVSASWDLARLLAPHEAMQHHHEEPRRAQLRLALLAKVAQLVAARCRLLQRDGLGAGPSAPAAELEAALDLLTGGHALPEVAPGTPCPAAPRFQLEPPRSASSARRSDPIRRSSLTTKGNPGSENGGGEGDDGVLSAAGLGAADALDDGDSDHGGSDYGGR